MALLKIKIVFILIIFSVSNGTAQNNLEIQRACLSNGKLKVIFVNHSQTDIMVPCLSYRYDISADEKYLDNRYVDVIGDTLVITLTKEHPAGLIDSKGTKAQGSKVEFNDVLLRPGKRYKSQTRMNISYEDLKFIKIQYDGSADSKQLCIE